MKEKRAFSSKTSNKKWRLLAKAKASKQEKLLIRLCCF